MKKILKYDSKKVSFDIFIKDGMKIVFDSFGLIHKFSDDMSNEEIVKNIEKNYEYTWTEQIKRERWARQIFRKPEIQITLKKLLRKI